MRKFLLPLLIAAIIPLSGMAQETFKVRGKVTDAKSGEALIGVNVILTALSLGAVTDLDGSYSFNVPKREAIGQQLDLVASLVSYKKKTIKVTLTGSDLTQNIALEEDIFQYDAVVVTGIASKTSKSVAEVSVARIPVADLTSVQNYQGLSQLVSGKIPGVNVNISSGNAGAGWNFFVRGGGGFNGDGQPLIYIDGVRIENNSFDYYGVGGQEVSALSSLNPYDIENIEVLKGPAAASSYGTNASNGVVLITTKSGKLRLGPAKPYSIDYQFTFGQNSQRFKYPSEYLNADTINQILETPGMIREHSLSISGGSAALRYFASYQNRFDAGTIPSQNYLDRNSLKATITAIPNETMSLRMNATYSWTKIRRPNNDNNIYGWLLNALSYWPAYATTPKNAIEAIKDMHNLNDFIGSANLTWKPLPELEIVASGGLEFNQYTQDRLYPYGFKYNVTFGTRSLYNRTSRQLTYDVNAKYAYKNFLVENLNVIPTVGTQIVSRLTNANNILVQEFGSVDIYDIGAGITVTDKGDAQVNRREAGIYASLPFNYEDTYFWTLGVRKDYVSAVGTSSPSIVYPSASVGVRLDRFGFLPEEISMLKLRLAYGESGQLPNTTDGLPLMYRTIAGASGSGLGFNSMGNPEIEPERIKEFEIGFDTEFLNMFSLEVTYYQSDASKSIIRSAFSPSTGLGSYTFPYNIGSVKGQGFESLLQFNPLKTADYDLSTSLIWNYQTNEVRDLGTTTELLTGFINVLKPGLPKYQYYDYKVYGAKFDATGKYTGVNASATFEDLGTNPIPKHTGSFTLNFRFLKNFQFYGMAEWALGHHAWSYTVRRSIAAGSYQPSLELQAKLGLTTRLPEITRLTVGSQEYIDAANAYAFYHSSYYGNFIYPADVLSIREMSLSYNFTELMQSFLPASYITGVQAGVSVRNAFKWTKFPLDPEVNTGGGELSTSSQEFATLPQPRTFNVWARFTF